MHGRRDAAALAALIEETGAELVIDATHPYASAVTGSLRQVCREAGVEYLRVLRREAREDDGPCVFAADHDEAAAYLDTVEGNVLLTVGSKALPRYTGITGADRRLYARVLSLPEAAEQAAALGFTGRRLICMQGPFSEELNAAMLRWLNIRWLVTKDSGEAGGFAEKLRAAKACGVTPVVIRRPREEGVTVEECLALLRGRYGLAPAEKQVTILGAGPGSPGSLTLDGEAACARAELIVGSARLIRDLSRFGKRTAVAVLPEEIAGIIEETDARRIVAVMSGDTGFFSGTKALLPLLEAYRPQVLPGLSSAACLCARLGKSWDDALLVSAHGRACNLAAKVRRHPKVIVLAGGADGVPALLRTLCACGLGGVRVTVGENLSYPDERITTGTAETLGDRSFDPLALLLIENPEAARAAAVHGRPDGDFLRGDVPMTKQEVRAVTLSKLRLTRTGVCWDVGAGTGSVSLEMAECCEDGVVYAAERREDACRLIEENKRRLGVDNVTVIRGEAPECLADLPAPDFVFIGGSGGSLRAVLETALEKNPAARIVLNTVTAETFAEAVAALKALPVRDLEITQINVARSRKAGAYHLMTAQNPVAVICCQGGGTDG